MLAGQIRIYREIIFECLDIAEEFLYSVLLLIEGEEFGDVRVQGFHVLEHILQDLVRLSGFLCKRLQNARLGQGKLFVR